MVARSSKVTGFTLSFLVGLVVGMLGTFATLNGRIVALEVQIKSLSETLTAIHEQQGTQQTQLDDLAVELARTAAAEVSSPRKVPR